MRLTLDVREALQNMESRLEAYSDMREEENSPFLWMRRDESMNKSVQVPEQCSQFFLSWAEGRRVLSNAETVKLLCGEACFVRVSLVTDSAAGYIFPKVGHGLTCSHLLGVSLFSRSPYRYPVE